MNQLFPNKEHSCSTVVSPFISPEKVTSDEETTSTKKTIVTRKRKSPRFNYFLYI